METTHLSFSTPDKSSVQEEPFRNPSASYNEARFKTATSTRAKPMASRKRGSTETKNGSRPRRQNSSHPSISIGEIPPNLSTPRVRQQPIHWFGNGEAEDDVDDSEISPSHAVVSVLDDRKNPPPASQPIDDIGRRYLTRESGFPRLPTRGIGDRGRSAITTRRQALQRPVGEDSYVSIEKVSRDFPPPPPLPANDQRFIRREDVDYESRLNEGRSDAFYRDTVPRESLPLNYYAPRHRGVYPSPRFCLPPPPPPPQHRGMSNATAQNIMPVYAPNPSPRVAQARLVAERDAQARIAQQARLLPANWLRGPLPRLPSDSAKAQWRSLLVMPGVVEDDIRMVEGKSSGTLLGWMAGKPKKSPKKSSSGKRLSVSSTEGSPTRPAHPSDGIFQHNASPVITDLGRWQNRKAKLWTELNPTISKDNTMGEAARQAKMLADFGKKNRHCIFGVRIEVHTSEEEHPYDSVDEPLDSPPTPRSPELIDRRDYSRTSGPKLRSRHLRTSRLIDDSSSNDEDVTPTFEPAGLEDEMKAWRLRGKDHNDDDDESATIQYYVDD
jgi:hypothetical protein